MRGDEWSFPVRVHGPSGEIRRHRTSNETGLLQSTEERRYFRRRLRQLSRGLARQRHDDFVRLSRLVQQQGRGTLSAGHRQTVCLLSATWHRHVQARHQRTWSDLAHRYHEKGVTTLRQNEYGEAACPCRSIVGYDANALYLWSLMQDMPMGWYTRRREENDFRPDSAQLY